MCPIFSVVITADNIKVLQISVGDFTRYNMLFNPNFSICMPFPYVYKKKCIFTTRAGTAPERYCYHPRACMCVYSMCIVCMCLSVHISLTQNNSKSVYPFTSKFACMLFLGSNVVMPIKFGAWGINFTRLLAK